MKYLLCACFVCLLIIPSCSFSQNARINSWGFRISPAKFYDATILPRNIYIPGYGTVAVNNSGDIMYRSDVNIIRSHQNKRRIIEYGIGLRTQEYTINKKAVAGANFIGQQSLIVGNYTLKPHFALGYYVWNRRAVQILATVGTSYDILNFKRDYNYFNTLLKAAFKDQTIINLLGEPTVVTINNSYLFPRLTLLSGVEVNIYRFGIGVMYDYQNKMFEISSSSSKPYFLQKMRQVRIQISFLFRNSYVQ